MDTGFQKLIEIHASELAKESNMKQRGLTTLRNDYVDEGVKLWASDWVKEEEKRIFMDFDKEYVHPDSEVIDALIKKVTYDSQSIHVSNRDNFEYVLEVMGFVRFSWFKQIWYKLEKFDKKHFEEAFDLYQSHLYYTSKAQIDFEKVITEFYESKKFPSEFTKFFELSTFSFENKLKEWFNAADKKVLDHVYELIKERCKAFGSDDSKVEYKYDYYLPAYWYYRLAHNLATVPFDALTSEFGGKFAHPSLDKESSEKNMIFVSAFYGHDHAFEYFWEYLDSGDKIDYFVKTVAHTFDCEYGFNYYGPKFNIIVLLVNESYKSPLFWTLLHYAVYKGEVPLICFACVYAYESYYWFPSFETLEPYIPKASKLSADAKDYALHALVEVYKFDWAHHEWTRFALKIKEFAEKVFQLMEYNVQ